MKRTTVLLATAFACLALAPVAGGAVVITRIYYDSPGTDRGSTTSLNAELIRIKNTGSRARSLSGWRVADAARHVYVFGTFTLRAGASVTIHTGSGSDTGAHRYWGSGWYIWNNDRDTATLRTRSGVVADRCSYNSSSADHSAC